MVDMYQLEKLGVLVHAPSEDITVDLVNISLAEEHSPMTSMYMSHHRILCRVYVWCLNTFPHALF